MVFKHLQYLIDNPIRYSSSNELTSSEIGPLGINNQSKVLCITASGSRPLDLLTGNPNEIITIDKNPAQNHLLELKMAAFRNLSYDELLEFLGVHPCNNRLAIYHNALKSDLTPSARDFWNKYQRLIKKGVIFSGRLENFVRVALDPLLIFIREDLKNLLNSTSLQDQMDLYTKCRRIPIFDIGLKLSNTSFARKALLKDPAFYAYTDRSFADFLDNRLKDLVTKHPPHQNFFLGAILKGKYLNKVAMPTYLREESYLTIKNNLHRIKIVTDDILNYLHHCPEDSFDAFSLSDFTCYVSQDYFEKTLKDVLRVGKSHAMICYRNFFTKRHAPECVNDLTIRNLEAEALLENIDVTCMYTFTVLAIAKKPTTHRPHIKKLDHDAIPTHKMVMSTV